MAGVHPSPVPGYPYRQGAGRRVFVYLVTSQHLVKQFLCQFVQCYHVFRIDCCWTPGCALWRSDFCHVNVSCLLRSLFQGFDEPGQHRQGDRDAVSLTPLLRVLRDHQIVAFSVCAFVPVNRILLARAVDPHLLGYFEFPFHSAVEFKGYSGGSDMNTSSIFVSLMDSIS